MYNKKELYYILEYIMPKKDGAGAIKIKIDFSKHHMKYDEIAVDGNVIMKSIFIKGYDYDLAVDVFLEAYTYKSRWLEICFF